MFTILFIPCMYVYNRLCCSTKPQKWTFFMSLLISRQTDLVVLRFSQCFCCCPVVSLQSHTFIHTNSFLVRNLIRTISLTCNCDFVLGFASYVLVVVYFCPYFGFGIWVVELWRSIFASRVVRFFLFMRVCWSCCLVSTCFVLWWFSKRIEMFSKMFLIP